MARPFWTLMPKSFYTHKQLAQGGRNEVLFTAVGTLLQIQDASLITSSTPRSIANLSLPNPKP